MTVLISFFRCILSHPKYCHIFTIYRQFHDLQASKQASKHLQKRLFCAQHCKYECIMQWPSNQPGLLLLSEKLRESAAGSPPHNRTLLQLSAEPFSSINKKWLFCCCIWFEDFFNNNKVCLMVISFLKIIFSRHFSPSFSLHVVYVCMHGCTTVLKPKISFCPFLRFSFLTREQNLCPNLKKCLNLKMN